MQLWPDSNQIVLLLHSHLQPTTPPHPTTPPFHPPVPHFSWTSCRRAVIGWPCGQIADRLWLIVEAQELPHWSTGQAAGGGGGWRREKKHAPSLRKCWLIALIVARGVCVSVCLRLWACMAAVVERCGEDKKGSTAESSTLKPQCLTAALYARSFSLTSNLFFLTMHYLHAEFQLLT